MTRDANLPEDLPPTQKISPLTEELENALYEIYFDAPRDQRERLFRELLADHPDAANALGRAREALARSEQMLGHLRTELDDAAAASQHIGPFEVVRVLGEGGFGTVYLAQQHEPVRRQVALKVLRRGHADDRSKRRFEAERQLLARLQHQNIAQVYDAGITEEQQHYLAMEFVDGQPITTWCEQSQADLKTRLRLFLRVCAAIHHAHQREVVHRDLKPSNVLVHDEDGKPVPKVIDFGIAKLLASEAVGDGVPEATVMGAQVGTPGYMSPEQAAGEWIDTRTDVYSLGVLLCELLTGEQPLSREKLRSSSFVAMARALAEEPPRRPSAIVGRSDRRLFEQLREDLDWIVLRAVAPARDNRYTSVAALAEDVERYLDREPVLARQNATRYVVRKFVQRHRLGVTLAGIAAVSLVGVLVALAWGLSVVGSARAEAERDRDLADSRGVAARMAVAQLALDGGDAETTREYLASIPVERRHWGWRHLASRVDNSQKVLQMGTSYMELLWLDESRVIAFPRKGDITCWNVDTGEAEYVFEGWQDTFFEAAFAIEHDAVLVAGSRDISLWNVRSGKRMRTLHRLPQEPFAVAWSEDRTLAVVGGRGRWLHLVPVRLNGAKPQGASASDLIPRKVKRKLHDNISSIAFCGQGQLLLGFERGEVRRVDLASGDTISVMRGHSDHVEHLVVDEEGGRVYGASVDGSVRAWDLATAEPRVELRTDVRMHKLALTGDRRILYAIGGWTDSCFEAWHTDTFELAGRFSGHLRGILGLALSPGETRIATSARDDSLRVWPIEPPRGSRKFEVGRDVRVLSANQNGSRFAAASLDGRITVWDAHTLEPELQLETRQQWWGSALHEDHLYVVGYVRGNKRVVRAIRIADGTVVREGEVGKAYVESLLPIAQTDRLIGCYGKNVLVWRLSDLELLYNHRLEVNHGRILWDEHEGAPILGDDLGRLHRLDPVDGTIESTREPFVTKRWVGAFASRGGLMVSGVGSEMRFERRGADPVVVTSESSSAAISPDLRRVVTGGPKHKVRVWDPATGDQLLVLGGMHYNIQAVHFVDGGRRVVGLAHRWDAPSYVHVWSAPDDVELGHNATGR